MKARPLRVRPSALKNRADSFRTPCFLRSEVRRKLDERFRCVSLSYFSHYSGTQTAVAKTEQCFAQIFCRDTRQPPCGAKRISVGTVAVEQVAASNRISRDPLRLC